MTAPKMMLASGCAASWTSLAALVDLGDRRGRCRRDREQHTVSAPMPRPSRAGDGQLAARMARSSPRAEPMPMSAEPAPCMTDLTSAKSRLISQAS